MARTDAEPDGRLDAIFERLPQGIASVDAELLVAMANDAFIRAVGASSLRRGSPLPEPWESFSLRDFAAGALTAGTPQEAIVSPDALRMLSITAIPPSTAGESVILIVGDVSERERAERLQREFVANASHELRTPIATISGAIEILQTGAKEDPAARDRFLGHIEREVSRLGRLVHSLLVLARAQSMQELPFLTPVRVRPLLDEAAASLTLAPGVEVLVTCAMPVAAHADPDLLLEVVLNLASNAAKYTRAGQVELFAEAQGRTVAIEIRDTGVGIPDEEQTALFARFYRGVSRDASGFGIGLAIVREAVLVLGGGVEVQSAPGVGTTVRVTLPRADEVGM